MCVSGIYERRHEGIYADDTKQPEQETQTQKEGPLPADLRHRPAVQTRRVVSPKLCSLLLYLEMESR